MLIGWSPLQNSSDLDQPVAYLFDDVIKKQIGGKSLTERRTVSPELLFGNLGMFSRAVHMLRFKNTYRVCTLSFHQHEVDVEQFNQGEFELRKKVCGVIELFLEMCYAGVPAQRRPSVVAGTHTHTGRLEINVAMPRYIITDAGQIRSHNAHPPQCGSRNLYDAFGDYVCATWGWKNPRHEASLLAIKGPNWVEKELASAERFNIEIKTEQRVLHFVKTVKQLAWDTVTVSNASFQEQLQQYATNSKFDVEWVDDGRVVLKDRFGLNRFSLRGYLLERVGKRPGIDGEPLDALRRKVTQRWERRAAYNSNAFGYVLSDGPNFDATLREPKLTISNKHPNFTRPISFVRTKASLRHRFGLAVASLRKAIVNQLAVRLVSQILEGSMLDRFQHLRKQMETSENAKWRTTDRRTSQLDDRIMRSPETAFGAGQRRGPGKYAEGTIEHLERDIAINGTSSSRFEQGSSAATYAEGRPGFSRAEAGGNRYEYELVAESVRTATVSRIAMIRRLSKLRPDFRRFSGDLELGMMRISFTDCTLIITQNGGAVLTGDIDDGLADELIENVSSAVGAEPGLFRKTDGLDNESELNELGFFCG